MAKISPLDYVFWYLSDELAPELTENIKTDICVVGGGMAGLMAAQQFRQLGANVVLIEKNFCGSGASGKSSGFITPDSELSLSHFIGIYGEAEARVIWEFGVSGVRAVEHNIQKYNLDCDYQVQDTSVVANSDHAFRSHIVKEHAARIKFGYDSILYEKKDLPGIISSSDYYGALSYSRTFGINTYRYCQELKKQLIKEGVRVHENTRALVINPTSIVTAGGNTIEASHIVLCVDQYLPTLNLLPSEVYHAQTYLMISAPLTDGQVTEIFPDKKLMVWDTDLIYTYYRVTGNNRLLLGGANIPLTYSSKAKHDNVRVFNKLSGYFEKKFGIRPNFEYVWPGLIGISKDIIPIAGRDSEHPSIYYVTASAGLPWAAALGRYSAEVIMRGRTDLDHFFNPGRKFFIGAGLQKIIGTKLAFALSNFKQINLL